MALPPSLQMDESTLTPWWRHYQSDQSQRGILWQLQNGPAGMAFHQLGFNAPPRFETAGIDLWRSAFDAFDSHGDLNSLLMWAEDGYAVRSELGGWENPEGQRSESLDDILLRPKRPGQLRDTFSGLLLTPSEAAQWLREWSLHVVDASKESAFPNGVVGRGPHGFSGLRAEAHDGIATYRVSQGDFKPTPNVPALWSRPQYEQYAQMPTLALLLRPEFAPFDSGMSLDQQSEMLQAVVKAMLDGRMEKQSPKRLFYSAAPGANDAAALIARCMARVAPQGGLLAPAAGFRMEHSLGGGLGAASMNAAVALASIAVWETDEPALVINLRDSRGALFFALIPPSPEQRRTQSPRPYVI